MPPAVVAKVMADGEALRGAPCPTIGINNQTVPDKVRITCGGIGSLYYADLDGQNATLVKT